MTSTAEELRELRSAVRGFLEQHAPVRAQLQPDGTAWKRLTEELGLAALPVDEEHGGAGAGFVEVAVVLEETGRVLLNAPYLSTVVAARVLQSLGVTGHLPGLADGSARACLALQDGRVTSEVEGLCGVLDQVVDAPGCDLLLVSAEGGLHLVDLHDPAVVLTPLQTLDLTRPQARVELNGVPGLWLGGPSAVAHAQDLLHVALAAESVGGAQRALEMTVEHLKVREQFGRPLGSFQALRHRVADLTAALEAARSTAWYAARAADGLTDDLPVVAPLAHATCADAYTLVTGESIQLHGGIGFTWEHDAHLYFKRAWTTSLLHGDVRALRGRAAARAGILPERRAAEQAGA